MIEKPTGRPRKRVESNFERWRKGVSFNLEDLGKDGAVLYTERVTLLRVDGSLVALPVDREREWRDPQK